MKQSLDEFVGSILKMIERCEIDSRTRQSDNAWQLQGWLASWARFWHQIWYLFALLVFRNLEHHQAFDTYTETGRQLGMACLCGRVFWVTNKEEKQNNVQSKSDSCQPETPPTIQQRRG